MDRRPRADRCPRADNRPHGDNRSRAADRDPRAWIGTGKALYEQVRIGYSADGAAGTWSIDVWAPHVPRVRNGAIMKRDDGYWKYCGDDKNVGLTVISGDKAKAILDKSQFFTTAMIRIPHLLARDDAGVYYYVDQLREQYGGKGFRVFVGKKGAMKQLPLTDIATDSAGEVFSTRTGDIRIIHDDTDELNKHGNTTWVKGEKKTSLLQLDLDMNSPLIFRDLGVYSFTGALCDER